MHEVDIFSRELRAGLIRKDMTRPELAQRLGTSEATLGRWLRGELVWPLDKALLAASILDINLPKLEALDAA